MNEIKIDIHKKFDGIDVIKEHLSNHQNNKKSYNFPLSPKNKNINSLNLGNINSRKTQKFISKDNSSDKTLLDKKKMNKKDISYNNLNDSKINSTNKIKVKGNLELKEKDINNFKEFQKLKDSNNDIYFRKGSLTNRLGPILFSNNSTKNNILLKAGQNMIQHYDSLKIKNGSEESNKINKKENELKHKPLIVKLDPKRDLNERGNSMNKKDNSKTKLEDKEKIKRIKTPTKKIFIESDRSRECLSDIFYLNKNIVEFNEDKNKSKNSDKIKIISPEENHFKAVFYSQEIKKFNKALE
jgi:hypothetical protein